VQYPERTQHGGLLMQMDVENVAPLRMTNIFTGTDSYSLLNFFNLKSQSMIWWTISLLRWSVFQPSSHPVLCCTRVSVFDSIYSSFGINVDISLELLSVTMLREPVETSYGPPFSTSTLQSKLATGNPSRTTSSMSGGGGASKRDREQEEEEEVEEADKVARLSARLPRNPQEKKGKKSKAAKSDTESDEEEETGAGSKADHDQNSAVKHTAARQHSHLPDSSLL